MKNVKFKAKFTEIWKISPKKGKIAAGDEALLGIVVTLWERAKCS